MEGTTMKMNKMLGFMGGIMVPAVGVKFAIVAVAGFAGSFIPIPGVGTAIGVAVGVGILALGGYIGGKIGEAIDNRNEFKDKDQEKLNINDQGEKENQERAEREVEHGQAASNKIALTYKILRKVKLKDESENSSQIGIGNQFKAGITKAYTNLLAEAKSTEPKIQLKPTLFESITNSINQVINRVKRENRNTLGFSNTKKQLLPESTEEVKKVGKIDLTYQKLGADLITLSDSQENDVTEVAPQTAVKEEQKLAVPEWQTRVNKSLRTNAETDASSKQNFWYNAAKELLQKDEAQLEEIETKISMTR